MILTVPEVLVNENGSPVEVNGTLTVSQSGIWTLQPGNTVNTSAWQVVAAQSGTWTIANTATNINIINSANWVKKQASTATWGAITVGTAATQILATNATRLSYIIVHTDTTAYFGFSSSLNTANGFVLVANQIFGGDDYTGTVFGIVQSGNTSVRYLEV